MKLQDPSFNISGTYNIDRLLSEYTDSLLLPDGRSDFFRTIAEDDMRDIGVATFDFSCDDKDNNGYGDEWYFIASTGRTIGIGFRWETPRLRGNLSTTIDDVIEFIDYLYDRLR